MNPQPPGRACNTQCHENNVITICYISDIVTLELFSSEVAITTTNKPSIKELVCIPRKTIQNKLQQKIQQLIYIASS